MSDKETKVIYGVQMNIYQRDAYTIQLHIGDAVTTVEHSEKHENKVRGNGDPYARVHDNLFGHLKDRLVAEGKWDPTLKVSRRNNDGIK